LNYVRDKSTVIYNTALPVIFGVKKYAAALMEVVKQRFVLIKFDRIYTYIILFNRNIQLNTRLNLVEVRADSKEAIFENLDQPGSTKPFKVIQ
jgi:sulfide:quinone oxidoreductase